MPRRDVVVVGASAGGVEALRDLVRELPADLEATVLVVLHMPPAAFSALPAILDRSGKLPARTPAEGEVLEPGVVFVAPPDRHLLLRHDHVVLGYGPKENGHRPAIDPLFRSAARWRGPRAVGVILSGTLDDGAAGLATLVECGGAALVQDPESALYDSMPCAAIRAVPGVRTATVPALATLISDLCREDVAVDASPAERLLEMETEIPEMGEDALSDEQRPGRPAAMTCPDCNGATFELTEGLVLRFRCRVGHAWSPDSLLMERVEEMEGALWAAIRSLEEKAALHRQLADRAAGSRALSARRGYHEGRAKEADSSAALLRDLLRRPLIADDAPYPHEVESER